MDQTISRQIRKEQMRTHRPHTKMLMTYIAPDSGEKVAKVMGGMGTHGTADIIMRTLRWASQHGVEIKFTPI